ncbi:DUF4261 domain-containing protein, partial [Suttonella ornithocola]
MAFKGVGFVLLQESVFDFYRLVQDLNAIGINASKSDVSNSDDVPNLIYQEDDRQVIVAMMPAPVPDDEAVINAEANYLWEDAVAVTKTHQAHLIVSVLGEKKESAKNAALLAFVAEKCLAQETALGFNFAGTVFEPKSYMELAHQHLQEQTYPTDLLVYVGLYQSEEGRYGYTFGLESFGKRELEVLSSQEDIWEIYQMLYNISTYVITHDVTFQEGETLGYSETQKLTLTFSKGVALPEYDT